MTVIGIIGMPGSGKEEFVQVGLEHGFSVVRMGDVVREYAGKKGLDPSDRSVGGLAASEREEHGLDIWARRTLPRLEGDCIIDGIRSPEELSYFKVHIPGLVLVAITVRPETRYKRIRARGRSDAPGTYDEFLARDSREKGWSLAEAMEQAQHVLPNDDSLEEFRKSVGHLLDKLEER